MATDPTVRISVNRQRREFATQDIGVRGADMGVANSLASISQSQANMAGTAFDIAEGKRREEVKSDLRKLTKSDIIRRDTNGEYESSIPALLGKVKNRGSIYRNAFREGAFKKFNDTWQLEIQAKSANYMRKYPINSIAYEKSMNDYFDTVSKNMSDEEQGSLGLIFDNVKTSGIDSVKNSAFAMQAERNKSQIASLLANNTNTIVNSIRLNNGDISYDDNLFETISKLVDERTDNSKSAIDSLGANTIIPLDYNARKKSDVIEATSQIVKETISALTSVDSTMQTKIVEAFDTGSSSKISKDTTVVVHGKDYNLKELVNQLIDVGVKTGSLDTLRSVANTSENIADNVISDIESQKRQTEEISNIDALQDNQQDHVDIRNAVDSMIEMSQLRSDDLENVIRGQSVPDFTPPNLTSMLSTYSEVNNKIKTMETKNIGTTRSAQVTATEAKNYRDGMKASISRVLVNSLANSTAQQKNAVQGILNGGGKKPNYARNVSLRNLPAHVKEMLNSNELRNLDAKTASDISRDVLSAIQTQNTANKQQADLIEQKNIVNLLSDSSSDLSSIKPQKIEDTLLAQLGSTATPEQKQLLAGGGFFQNYNPVIHGQSDFYDEAVKLAETRGIVIPMMKDNINNVFSGAANITSSQLYNTIQLMDRIAFEFSDTTTFNPIINQSDMNDSLEKYQVIKSLEKLISPSKDAQGRPEYMNYLRVLNEIDNDPKALDMAYTKYSTEQNADATSGKQTLQNKINKHFGNSPTAKIMTSRIVDYWVAVTKNGDADMFGKFVEDIANNYFVSSEGTIPVISQYDIYDIDLSGNTRSYLSINKILGSKESVKTFNKYAEFDAEFGIASQTNGQFSFFLEEGESKPEYPKREKNQSMRPPVFDEVIFNPLKKYSLQEGGIKKAFLIAHPHSSTDVGGMVSGKYTNDILYFAYYLDDDGRMQPVRNEETNQHIMYNMKDFMNSVNTYYDDIGGG